MSKKSAIELMESVKDMQVLFAGDTIIDEYQFVTPLGKSPKEHLIPVALETKQEFRGGVEAAASHARNFCGVVDILSFGMIIKKTRMVDLETRRKLFEIHSAYGMANHNPIPDRVYDILVVTDFGHGELGKGYREWVCEQPGYLCVNAQTNSSNIGFNLITRYERADYVVIDEPEARLAAQDRTSPIEEVIEALAVDHYAKMIVTRGRQGAVGFDGTHFYKMHAFDQRPIDTMGAGDAFYAVTAPMSKDGSIEDLLLIGSAAAAVKCGIVGHRESVTKEAILEMLKGAA